MVTDKILSLPYPEFLQKIDLSGIALIKGLFLGVELNINLSPFNNVSSNIILIVA